MPDKFRPAIEAKLESVKKIAINATAVEKEGFWYLQSANVDVTLSPPISEYADSLRLKGRIGDYTFETIGDRWSRRGVCHETNFPENELSFSAKKSQGIIAIEITKKKGQNSFVVKNIEIDIRTDSVRKKDEEFSAAKPAQLEDVSSQNLDIKAGQIDRDKTKEKEVVFEGKIVRWFSEKGFGFFRTVKPLADGKNEIFVHVRDLCSHADEKKMMGMALSIIPEKDPKGWRVKGRRGAMCGECKKEDEVRLIGERAADIVKFFFGERYGLAEGCHSTVSINEVGAIVRALKNGSSRFGFGEIPEFTDDERKRYAQAMVSGDVGLVEELKEKILIFEKEKKRLADDEKAKRDQKTLDLWNVGLEKQEEFIRNESWLEEKAKAVRNWFKENNFDASTFTLSVDYHPVYSYSSKGWGRSGDDVEESFEGMAYAIVASGGQSRKGEKEFLITLDDFYYSYNKDKGIAGELDGAFRYFVRRDVAVEVKNTIGSKLADLYDDREKRLTADHMEATAYDEVITKLLAARKKMEIFQKRVRYSVNLSTPADCAWGDINKDSIQDLRDAAEGIEKYVSVAEKEFEWEMKRRDEEQKRQETERSEAAKLTTLQAEAEYKEFGAAGHLLEIARVLAAETERKLGLEKALELVDSAVNAPYGRARRQYDIQEALGESEAEAINQFLRFSRASDVDGVLTATFSILERQNEKPKKPSTVVESGGGIMAVALAKATEKKEARSGPAENKKIEVKTDIKISAVEAQKLRSATQAAVLLLEATLKGISTKPTHPAKNKEDAQILAKATESLRSKKSELLKEIEGFIFELAGMAINTGQDKDVVNGKISHLNGRVDSLFKAKERKVLFPKGINDDWKKTLVDLWESVPTAVIDATAGVVAEVKQPELIIEVRKKLLGNIDKIQADESVDLRRIIDDEAEKFLE